MRPTRSPFLSLLLACGLLHATAWAAPQDPDPSFGSNGIVQPPIFPLFAEDPLRFERMALLADQRSALGGSKLSDPLTARPRQPVLAVLARAGATEGSVPGLLAEAVVTPIIGGTSDPSGNNDRLVASGIGSPGNDRLMTCELIASFSAPQPVGNATLLLEHDGASSSATDPDGDNNFPGVAIPSSLPPQHDAFFGNGFV